MSNFNYDVELLNSVVSSGSVSYESFGNLSHYGCHDGCAGNCEDNCGSACEGACADACTNGCGGDCEGQTF